jgi:predicted ATP-dependent serine protease
VEHAVQREPLELSALRSHLQSSVPGVILLSGDSGVGKSTLLLGLIKTIVSEELYNKDYVEK